MAELVLNATIRKSVGRKFAKHSRNSGEIPGIFYLGNQKNVPIQVKTHDLRPVIYTAEVHIINLKLDDGSENRCVLKDVQFDPITDDVVHFDLIGLVEGAKIKVELPIVLHGTPLGVKEGGVLEHLIHRVEVDVLPKDMPEHIAMNVEHLHIGQSLTIGDINIPGVHIHLDPSVNVVTVTPPRVIEEAVVEAEGAEPEVIGEEGEAEAEEKSESA